MRMKKSILLVILSVSILPGCWSCKKNKELLQEPSVVESKSNVYADNMYEFYDDEIEADQMFTFEDKDIETFDFLTDNHHDTTAELNTTVWADMHADEVPAVDFDVPNSSLEVVQRPVQAGMAE